MAAPSTGAAQGAPPSGRADLLRAGLDRLRAGEFAAAARLVEPLYHARPDDADALLLLGLALAGCAHPDLAADLLDEVARRRPHAPHPAHDAIALLSAARCPDAIAAYLEAAMAHAPDDPRLLVAAGAWLHAADRGPAARAALERATTLQPTPGEAQVALAAVLAEAGQLDAAEALLRSVVASGRGSASAPGNLALVLETQGRGAEALAAFAQARRSAPEHVQLAVNHGAALLRAGRFAEGWPLLNRRLDLPGRALLPPARLLPRLAPDARLDGQTVLVTQDCGFGDTIQFARYLPKLAETGARVMLSVPETLRRLLACIPNVAIVSDEDPRPAHDWHCPAIRLAEVFATTRGTVPRAIPYLRADPALVAAWAARLPAPDGRRRVGLAWAGSARPEQPRLASIDRRRSIDPPALAPLLARDDIQWVSLQQGRPPLGGAVFDPMGAVADFADTAAIMASLDAVVSVDTAVAHLAGATGMNTILLDRADHCWRWLSGRADSPWYPTMRIVRQTEWGDWDAPIRTAAAMLAVVAAQSTAPYDPAPHDGGTARSWMPSATTAWSKGASRSPSSTD